MGKRVCILIISFLLFWGKSEELCAQPSVSEQAIINVIISNAEYKAGLAGFREDANYVYGNFSAVAIKTLAYTLSAGWVDDGQVRGTFPSFAIGVFGSLVNMPSSAKSFYLDNNKLKYIQLKSAVDGQGESRTIATIFGDPGMQAATFESKPRDFVGHPDQVEFIPKGFGINYLPSSFLKGQLGIIKGTDFVFKFLPPLSFVEGGYKTDAGFLIGVGLAHDLGQWFFKKVKDAPSSKAIMPHIAFQGSYTVYDLSIQSPNLAFPKSFNNNNTFVADSVSNLLFTDFVKKLNPLVTTFKFSSIDFSLAASLKIAFFIPFVSVGYAIINAEQIVTGDVPAVALDNSNGVLANRNLVTKISNPINRSTDVSTFKLIAGAKFKMGPIAIHAAYNYIDYSVYQLGLQFIL